MTTGERVCARALFNKETIVQKERRLEMRPSEEKKQANRPLNPSMRQKEKSRTTDPKCSEGKRKQTLHYYHRRK